MKNYTGKQRKKLCIIWVKIKFIIGIVVKMLFVNYMFIIFYKHFYYNVSYYNFIIKFALTFILFFNFNNIITFLCWSNFVFLFYFFNFNYKFFLNFFLLIMGEFSQLGALFGCIPPTWLWKKVSQGHREIL